MPFEKLTPRLLPELVERLGGEFAQLPEFEPRVPGAARMAEVLNEVAERLGDNYPYHHPLYAGQMLKPPHPIARAAYALATWINPNNHALDGGRASSAMEKEAVAAIARMFGWEPHLGHLTSGGTFANLEALWVAGQLREGQTILASEQAHYTHGRISGVLRVAFESVPVDGQARLDLEALERRLEAGGVGCVVATLGTTGVGALDPLPEILKLRERYGFRVHVDAAYGGYFRLAQNLSDRARAIYAAISEADSIVVDPHKHGLQPYGCGCILFRDPSVGRLYRHDSPYTYFSSRDLHLGEISLECSRPGASAVALWATERLLPLVEGGEFAGGLESSRRAAVEFERRLKADARFVVPLDAELDIVVWAVRAGSREESSAAAQRIFDEAAQRNLHLALMQVPADLLAARWPEAAAWGGQVAALRSVMMKPEHEQWGDQIYTLLDEAARAAGV